MHEEIQPLAESEQQSIGNLFDTFSVGAFVFICSYGFTAGYIVDRFQRLGLELSES